MKKIRKGIIISDKMNKSRIVLEIVKNKKKHIKYKKIILRKKKYYAHDERNITKTGDKVILLECRPLSKTKRWIIKKNN